MGGLRILRGVPLIVATLALVPVTAQGQGDVFPAGWRQVIEGQPDSAVQLWVMKPGWHVTTTTAGLWWDTTWVARGETYVVEFEGFIFPDAKPGGYGLFIGGRDLGTPQASYTSFQVSSDGRFGSETRRGTSVLTHVPWKPAEAVARPRADADAKNVLRVEVGRVDVGFFINGSKAVTVARSAVEASGIVGLRVGRGVNLHVTKVGVTGPP